MTADELASKARTNPRLTREWLSAQEEAGFKRFRRASETPFNLVLEAQK